MGYCVYIYYFMYSCSKQNTRECNRSISCHFQQPITLNFCQKHPQKQTPNKTPPSPHFQGPTYNKDNNYLTSAFILSSQKKKYTKNKQQPAQNQNKYHNIYQQKSEILIPKPNTKNLHCNVCKEKYQDYLDHVGSGKHRKKIEGSACMGYIRELEVKYRRGRCQQKRVGKFVGGDKDKEVTITETSNCVIVIDQSKQEDEIEAMGRPSKRVKVEKNELNNPQQPRLPIPSHQYYTQYNQILNRLQTSYWQLLQLNPLAYQYLYPQIQTNPYYINPPPSSFPNIFSFPHSLYPPLHHHYSIPSTNQIANIVPINQSQNISYLLPVQMDGNRLYGCGGRNEGGRGGFVPISVVSCRQNQNE